MAGWKFCSLPAVSVWLFRSANSFMKIFCMPKHSLLKNPNKPKSLCGILLALREKSGLSDLKKKK